MGEESAPGRSFLRPVNERRCNLSVAHAIFRSRSNSATIVAASFTSVPPPVFGAELIIVFIDLDASFGRIGEPFFCAPAIAVLIANHSGGCTRCYSKSTENSQTSGLEILYYAFSL